MERILNGADSHLAGHEFLVPSALIMQKVVVSTCSSYDCEHVALAEDLNAALVTSYGQILSEFPEFATSLALFAETD